MGAPAWTLPPTSRDRRCFTAISNSTWISASRHCCATRKGTRHAYSGYARAKGTCGRFLYPGGRFHLHGHYLSVGCFKEQLLAIAAPARLLAAVYRRPTRPVRNPCAHRRECDLGEVYRARDPRLNRDVAI